MLSERDAGGRSVLGDGESLGERVRGLREAQGLSKAELGRRAGIGRDYVAQVEAGRIQMPGSAVLQRLAEALGVRSVDLLAAAGYVPQDELAGLPDVAGDPRLMLSLRRVARMPDGRLRQRITVVLEQLLELEADEDAGHAGS